ncbi:MAG: hypothetical protein IT384_12875 [Deltaproteobacteria bacterium]|nr:hypothetical protein [Deltaproteobacteria bacterium]
MDSPHFEIRPASETRVRELIREISSRIDAVKTGAPDAASALQASWQSLVDALAIAEAPATRECPRCQRTVMRAATLCGWCWTKLTPPAAELSEASPLVAAGAGAVARSSA